MLKVFQLIDVSYQQDPLNRQISIHRLAVIVQLIGGPIKHMVPSNGAIWRRFIAVNVRLGITTVWHRLIQGGVVVAKENDNLMSIDDY
jgi:hypothetical protein